MYSAKGGLSDEQVETFRENGFLVIDDIFTEIEVAELRTASNLDTIRESQQEKGFDKKAVHLLELTIKHPLFKDLARDERILDLIRPLIGNDIQLQHSKIATKPPTKGAGAFKMHQDFAFFPHTNTSLVAVMVMLDDATKENGCMQMISGSHKWGLLDHLENGIFSGGCVEVDRWADQSRLVDVTPRAGGISIHHCLSLHGSPTNSSGEPRRGLVFQYRADDAYQLADTVFEDTGTLVSGQRNGKVRCEPGEWQLPRRQPGNYGSAWNQIGTKVEF